MTSPIKPHELLGLLPATVRQIAERTGRDVHALRRRLNALHQRGLVHIGSHDRESPRTWARVWAAGSGADALPPRTDNRAFDLPAYGDATRRVLAILREDGPMTRREIETQIGAGKNLVARLMLSLRSESPRYGKRVHISGWVYDAEGQGRYPRPVYAIGPGRDVKKPARDADRTNREYEQRKKMLAATNSVFNLARLVKWQRKPIEEAQHRVLAQQQTIQGAKL